MRLTFFPIASLALCSVFCADFSDPKAAGPSSSATSTGSATAPNCPTEPCDAPPMVACEQGRANCDGYDGQAANACETNTATSSENCCVCANRRSSNQVCNAGTCAASRDGGRSQCGNSCVELQSDTANCGACGNACPESPNGTPSCQAGICRILRPTALAVTAGDEHSCALMTAGTVKCLGANEQKRLGDLRNGTPSSRSTVEVPDLRDVARRNA
jgi:hypothetical protein